MTTAAGPARRRIIVIRHAKSSWDDPSIPDHDRPLAGRGRKTLPHLRAHLDGLGLRPDHVLCSSARRAQDTLDGVREVLGSGAVVEVDRALYGADASELLERLRGLDDGATCAWLIGHNPGLEELVDSLAGDEPRRGSIAFPTAAVAVLAFPGGWPDLAPDRASLESLWLPRHGEIATS